jgi:ABC-2 type transport system permease protein
VNTRRRDGIERSAEGTPLRTLDLHGFGAFTRKELIETRKTWRLWVLPGVLVFLGLTTPVLAAVTPALLEMTAQRRPGVVIEVPAPTAVDSYAQFMGNLAQLALLVVIITGAAAVAGERRGGTAVLVLTKPLSRTSFVWSKALANLVILLVATAIGTALCVAVTIALFDASHVVPFVESVGVWLALAAMLVCLMIWLSAALEKQAAAAGGGLAVYASLFALTGFPAVRAWTPAGILAANDALLKGEDVALGRPVAVTLLLALVFLVLAAWSFRHKEL